MRESYIVIGAVMELRLPCKQELMGSIPINDFPLAWLRKSYIHIARMK